MRGMTEHAFLPASRRGKEGVVLECLCGWVLTSRHGATGTSRLEYLVELADLRSRTNMDDHLHGSLLWSLSGAPAEQKREAERRALQRAGITPSF